MATQNPCHIQINTNLEAEFNHIIISGTTKWSTTSPEEWCHHRFHLADLVMITAANLELEIKMANLYPAIWKMIDRLIWI